MMNRYSFIKWAILPILKLYIKEIKGIENFPKKGRYIFVANHNSLADDVAMAYLYILQRVDGKVSAIARQKPLKDNFIDNLIMDVIAFFSNAFFRIINSYEEGKISKAVQALNKGYCFFNHPEGRVNTNPKVMLKAKTGTARIALISKVPVIPIGVIDTEKVLPLNSHFPRFRRLSINIGKPLTFKEYYGKEDDKATLEKITTIFMKEVALLSGKLYPY